MTILVKNGMGGSSGGRGRWEPTAVLKNLSKPKRRQTDRKEVQDILNDTGPLPASLYNPDYETDWEALEADMGGSYLDPVWDEDYDPFETISDPMYDPMDDLDTWAMDIERDDIWD